MPGLKRKPLSCRHLAQADQLPNDARGALGAGLNGLER
jgi:hypothetical protein